MKIRYLLLFLTAFPLFAVQGPFTPAEPLATRIETPPAPTSFTLARNDTLKYDGGGFLTTYGIGGGSIPDADETVGFATYFVLSEFGFTAPRKIGSILIHFEDVRGTDFRIYVWDDAGGVPNSHGTPLYVNMNAPLGMHDVWTDYNLVPDNVIVPDTFWIGVCYNVLSTPIDWNISVDLTTSDDHTYGNLDGDSTTWVPMGDLGYGNAFGIRVVLEDNHDVAPVAIYEPPFMTKPGSTHEPEVIYRNYGAHNETFDAYFVIDSSGSDVYFETMNFSLDAGADTTITWPPWTAASNLSIVYDGMTYTALVGDEEPSNDTLRFTVTTANLFWEILDPPALPIANSGHSEATADDGYYYVFGIGYDSTLIFDIDNNVWMDGPNNPYGDAQYGTANYVNGKFYRIGGWDGTAPLSRVDIYDPVSTDWSAGADAPSHLVSHITGVYKDSLIFSLGGGNWFSGVSPNSNVYFYDTYLDTWRNATSFPGAPRGSLAGGVIDSFAIVACGYDNTAMRIDYVVGVINQTNAAVINWDSPQNIPGIDSLYRMGSCVDTKNKELWMVGGATWFTVVDATWSYAVYTDTWTHWQLPKPQPVYDVTPLAITVSDLGDQSIYVAGGRLDNDVADTDDHEVFHTNKTSIEERPGQPTNMFTFGFASTMPNPTRGYIPISYTTTQSGKVSLKVYDQTGRLVRTLVNRPLEAAGTKTVYWDAKDDARRTAANGIYFVKLEAEEKTATHKLILVK